MDLKNNSVITLEDSKKYIILKNLDYLSNKYYFAMQLDENKKIIPNDIVFFLFKEENGEKYIEVVEDDKLITELIKNMY